MAASMLLVRNVIIGSEIDVQWRGHAGDMYIRGGPEKCAIEGRGATGC